MFDMFNPDKPIQTNQDDLLNRSGFSKMFAKTLANLDKDETFTIGLYGKWGTGKTSLINMVKEELVCSQDRYLVVVHFEPWNFSDENQLLSQFFIHLSNELKSKKDKSLEIIGNALDKYSDAFEIAKVIPYLGSPLAVFGKLVTKNVARKMKKGPDGQDISKQKEIVIDLLKNQDRQILIIIDDIDRLSNEQIRKIFQLVASVANFPKIIYLLAFDKTIVTNALEKVQEGSGEDYLEKIIQIPIQVPLMPENAIEEIFSHRLEMIYNGLDKPIFDLVYWQSRYDAYIEPFIKTLRDVNRLCNMVQFKLSSISSEVNFTDMVAISALEISLPEVYDWVKKNKYLLTRNQETAFMDGMKNEPQVTVQERNRRDIEALFQAEQNEAVRNEKVDKAIKFLSMLFPYYGRKMGLFGGTSFDSEHMKKNQIAHFSKFDRYFHLDLNQVGIKRSELKQAIDEMDVKELGKLMLEKDREENGRELFQEIKNRIGNIPEERIRVIHQAIVSVTGEINDVRTMSMPFITIRSAAKYLADELLRKVTPEKRKELLIEEIQNADMVSLECLSHIILRIEWAYGNLNDTNGVNPENQLVTPEELQQLANEFCDKTAELLRKNCLFDLDDWTGVFLLLENFSPNVAQNYLGKALDDEKNVLNYLRCCVDIVEDSSDHKVKANYKNFLTDEKILESISKLRRNKGFYSLSNLIRKYSACFYIVLTGKQDIEKLVSYTEINELLSVWRKEDGQPLDTYEGKHESTNGFQQGVSIRSNI